ncbi:uncharacterized protein RAG0_11929 [Rhynchosporium agropyri]|uniref:Uncharacterized protein n=1 Tax=Rhynchosporium agropyri TaxID=914238 RepID=A0A1E1L6G6_9HELO|nr:uncharacterized protein RAG0_11929 [Rhynchosporium agropyri]
MAYPQPFQYDLLDGNVELISFTEADDDANFLSTIYQEMDQMDVFEQSANQHLQVEAPVQLGPNPNLGFAPSSERNPALRNSEIRDGPGTYYPDEAQINPVTPSMGVDHNPGYPFVPQLDMDPTWSQDVAFHSAVPGGNVDSEVSPSLHNMAPNYAAGNEAPGNLHVFRGPQSVQTMGVQYYAGPPAYDHQQYQTIAQYEPAMVPQAEVPGYNNQAQQHSQVQQNQNGVFNQGYGALPPAIPTPFPSLAQPSQLAGPRKRGRKPDSPDKVKKNAYNMELRDKKKADRLAGREDPIDKLRREHRQFKKRIAALEAENEKLQEQQRQCQCRGIPPSSIPSTSESDDNAKEDEDDEDEFSFGGG